MDRATQTKAHFSFVNVRNVAAILETLKELRADADAVFRGAGIDPLLFSNPDNGLTFATLGRLVGECVKATGAEDFGLRVGAKTGVTALGLTGLVSIHSPTVRDALGVIAAGRRARHTGGGVILDQRGAVAFVQYVFEAAGVECADHIVDGAMAIVINTLRALCGPAWRPDQVRLTRDPPRNKAPFFQFFKAPIEYAASTASVAFDAAILDLPVRDRNPEYARILAPLLEDVVANSQGDLVFAVKSVMRGRIGAGALTRDSVCRALRLSARTLAHRLEAFGLTFSGLADEVRFDAAQSLLLKDRPIAEIASILGFAEPSAFARAFKKWSGTTPARWRSAQDGRRVGLNSSEQGSG